MPLIDPTNPFPAPPPPSGGARSPSGLILPPGMSAPAPTAPADAALRPRLRMVEAMAVEHEGAPLLLLRDPYGAAEPCLLPAEYAVLLELFDGTHTIEELRALFAQAGAVLPAGLLEDVCRTLDEARYLAGPWEDTFFDGLEARPPRHAAGGYPTEPGECRRYLDGLWAAAGDGAAREEGPETRAGSPSASLRAGSRDGPPASHPPSAIRSATEGTENTEDSVSSPVSVFGVFGGKNTPHSALRNPQSAPPPLRGLVAPHIDFHRGGALYAQSYRALSGSDAVLFVVLGTAHMPTVAPFVTWRMPFDTPLGRLPVDEAFLARLERRLGAPLPEDPWAHWGEHSIEFQALWLCYLFGDRGAGMGSRGAGVSPADRGAGVSPADRGAGVSPAGSRPALRTPQSAISFVPILCGSFAPCVEADREPETVPQLHAFIAALRAALAEEPRRTVLIAASDLSHVGAQFGGDESMTPAFLETLRGEDRALLDLLCANDAHGFFREVAAVANRRNVCSVANLYTLTAALPGARGALLGYDQAVDREADSAVTFAGVRFT